jgi:P4 family phage/plasmid primase-like protien
MSSTFDTVSFCVAHQIPSLHFPMTADKTIHVKGWQHINETDFYKHINPSLNGFAILTGKKFIMIDIDHKHDPPPNIQDTLERNCSAIEKTPGGFHYWFLNDARTAHFDSPQAAYWDGKKVAGLDIRGTGGLAYVTPSHYIGLDGAERKYQWYKGNLSTAQPITSDILEHISCSPPALAETQSAKDPEAMSVSNVSTTERDDVVAILAGLAPVRVDRYDDWLRVGMILYNCGYPCDLWDDWSKQSTKYRPGTCGSKWRTFGGRERPLTIATLYKWLKEDNYSLFVRLKAAKQSLRNCLLACSNATIANLFHHLNQHRYVFSHTEGWFVLQDNNTWLPVGSTDPSKIPNIFHAIRDSCLDMLWELMRQASNEKGGGESDVMKKAPEIMRLLSTASFLRGVLAFLSGPFMQLDIEKKFNERRELFAFTNGVYDLQAMQFRPIEPTDYITVTCGYEYREGSEDEKAMVRACLATMFPSEPVLDYMLQALSTTLEGENRGEFFHALTGVGANGKSCLMDLCKRVFGDYFRTIGVNYLTKDDEGKDRPLPDLVDARWARMLVASEPEEKDRFQVALLKLISGNDEISCRAMYGKNVVKYRPQFKLWILTNDMPKLSKFDQGIERRMRCVHFPVRFVSDPVGEWERKRDEGLKGRIMSDEGWRYGFLGLLLEAFGRGKGVVLTMPTEVREFTEAYMLENNPVGAWLRANYEMTGAKEDCFPKTELLHAFVEETGMSRSAKGFSDDMMKCNVGIKKVMGKYYYYGIRRKIIREVNEIIEVTE